MAQSNAILNNNDSNDWLLSQIEEGLNSGIYNLDNLDDGLEPFGFSTSLIDIWGESDNLPFVIVKNLFGDGRDARIIRITARESILDGILVGVGKDELGVYKLELIFKGWDFISGGGISVIVGDKTGDGIPEVVITVHWCGMGCYNTQAIIYQWRDGSFVDLAQETIKLSEYSAWGYGASDENGIDTIEITRIDVLISSRNKEILKWSGEYYEFSHIETDTSLESYIYGFSWSPDDFLTTLALIEALLSEWPDVEADRIEFASSFPDLLRYQRGVVYAMASKTTKAQQEFASLIESRSSESSDAIIEAAQAFLDTYYGDRDLYQSCLEAKKLIDAYLEPYRDENGWASREGALEVVGHYPKLWPNPLCSLTATVPVAIQSIPSSEIKFLPAILTQAGMNVNQSEALDLNNDGFTDWILVIDDNVWIVLYFGDSHTVLLVNTPRFFDDIENLKVSVEEFKDTDNPIILIQSNTNLFVFRIYSEDGKHEILKLIEEYYVAIIDIITDNETHTINIFKDDPGLSNFWRMYSWESDSGDFDIVDRAADYLFLRKNPSEAIKIIDYALAQFDSLTIESNQQSIRLEYLLALAYELSGDKEKAAQLYYQIWQDHPGSAYALMARAKLVLVDP